MGALGVSQITIMNLVEWAIALHGMYESSQVSLGRGNCLVWHVQVTFGYKSGSIELESNGCVG